MRTGMSFNPWFNGFQIQSQSLSACAVWFKSFNPWFNGFQIQREIRELKGKGYKMFQSLV